MESRIDLAALEVWFITGSQKLYGEKTLKTVAEHSRQIAEYFSNSPSIPVKVVFKPVMTSAESIHEVCMDANRAKNCIGLIVWMHTFSPSQNWIQGLQALTKPLVHLHTQFNRELPWSTIDMDFMNLNQSAHGDREFGFITSRLRIKSKVVVGHWQDADVLDELGTWARAASAVLDWHQLKIAHFGGRMRRVAVTEADKVEGKIQFGFFVDAYGVGDLAARIAQVTETQVNKLASQYAAQYTVARPLLKTGSQHQSLRDAARIEIGLRRFLEEGGFNAFTDNFEDLNGLTQLPGVAVQRLMQDGYGFGAEGDWKTAALVRAMKVMSFGLPGGTSFMENYTYNLVGAGEELNSHMLEICPSIAAAKPTLEIHPLSIGGKADPVRLVFTCASGAGIAVSLMDMGDRFRMVANEVTVMPPEQPLPKLPVARAVWKPKPDLKVAAAAWILAGGAHHTGFSLALNSKHLEDFAEMVGVEFLLIDDETNIRSFKKELRWNEVYYRIARGF